MSSDFLLILRTYFAAIWSCFTSIDIPGVNFPVSTLIFGVLSFFVAIKLMKGIHEISTSGFSNDVVAAHKAKSKSGGN